MRLLTFMQMAETRKDISYDSMQQEMNLNPEDVEDFIIDGTHITGFGHCKTIVNAFIIVGIILGG